MLAAHLVTLVLLLGSLASPLRCAAQQPAVPAAAQAAGSAQAPEGAPTQAPEDARGEAAPELVTMFPHSETARWWISGQANVIFQSNPEFHAAYSGPNSFGPKFDEAVTHVETLYLGYQLTHSTEALLDVEQASGDALGGAVGLAGYTNLDAVRIPGGGGGAPLGSGPYIARVELHQIVRLSKEDVEADRGPLALAAKVPARRLEFRIGKMSTVDSFDINEVGSDSHLQFENWTIDNNGAYDYAADTRGYTYGAVAEYDSLHWAFRFGEMLMPKVANGIDLDWNLRRARAENYELELRPALLKNHKSAVRLLAYENHADMGDYQQAVARYLAGIDPRPIIENARRQGTVKYGFGVNLEQELPREVRAFLRLGWNEGEHESFAYTEVNSTAAFGADITGWAWHRKLDKIGAAFASNGISAAHQAYLRDGGLGFLLGDNPFYPAGVPAGSSALNYGRENIFETYYTAHLWRGVFFAGDLQRIWNPGYNRDRGPVLVAGTRLHVDF